jgi:hypothetical protein
VTGSLKFQKNASQTAQKPETVTKAIEPPVIVRETHNVRFLLKRRPLHARFSANHFLGSGSSAFHFCFQQEELYLAILNKRIQSSFS